MFIKDNKPFDIQAPHVIDEVQYPAGYFFSAGAREEHGVSEVPDPVSADPRFYFNVSEENGGIVSTPKPVELICAAHAQALAANRYAVETGGIVLNGVEIRTDRESQAMLNGALTLVTRNAQATVQWKGANGFVTLNATQIGQIADAVAAHVQACFSAEKAKLDALAAVTTFQEAVDFDPTIAV